MTKLEKELAIIDLYYENAELSLANDLYFGVFCESESSSGIAGFIQNLIQKFKDFVQSIQNRIQYNRLKRDLEEYREKLVDTIVDPPQKYLVLDADKVVKLGEEQVLAIYKLYGAVSTHKMSAEKFNAEMKRLDAEYETKLKAIKKSVSNVRKTTEKKYRTFKGKKPVNNARQILDVLEYQNRMIRRIELSVCKVNEKFRNAKDDSVGQATVAAQKISTRGRETIQSIIKVLGVAALASAFLAFAHKTKEKEREKEAESKKDAATIKFTTNGHGRMGYRIEIPVTVAPKSES